MKRFKLINTTVKPPKINPKTGQDLRTMVEKVGHDIEVILDNNAAIRVEKHRPKIVDHVNEGMLRLERGGFIRIEVVDDVTAMLKSHVINGNKDSILKPDENLKYQEPVHPAAEDRKAKVAQMGEEGKEPTDKLEGAVNPDGAPNFVVTASKDAKLSRKNKLPRDEPASEAPLDQPV